MASRRMFAKTIIDSDAFLEMPASTQLLYFHLSMRADDDGFINKPKAIMRITGTKDDDISLLIAKRFIIPFESGVVVIKHWKIHNYIQKDRYTETKYKEELAMLELDENKSYRLQNSSDKLVKVEFGHKMDTQDRLELDKSKNRIERDNKAKRFTPPTLEELTSYINEKNYNVNPETFIAHYESVGWRVGKNKMKDWKASVRGWHSRNEPVKKEKKEKFEYEFV